MGGRAFASGLNPLYTPRMPKAVYLKSKHQCFETLRNLYEVVASPIDGPGKTDFGDVDIALHGPKEGTVATTTARALEQISRALGAVRMIVTKGEEASSNLAVPWPDLPKRHAPGDAQEEDLNTAEPEERRYIQVDTTIFNNPSTLYWSLFKHAHGDIWNLIGATIRPYGLTVDHQAMWLRIPEIEKTDKKRARVFLTSDSTDVLKFLGLPVKTYFEGPFPDLNAMYEYVAQCRMFWVPPEDPDDELPDRESGAPANHPHDQGRQSLKANDRKRMNLRPGFRQWVDEFKPECRRLGRFSEKTTTREEVTAEAIARFHVGEEYDRQLHDFLTQEQRLRIKNEVIKKAIPELANPPKQREMTYRSCLVKAFQRIILEDDRQYGVTLPKDCKDQKGLFDVDKVLEFIETHKEEVGENAFEHHMDKYRARKEKK